MCRNLPTSAGQAPFGGATRLQFFEGREAWSVQLVLDLDGRVEALHSPEGELGFGYDAVGNIDGLQRKGEVRSIGYDALYRLDRVEAPKAGVLEAYSYDATGNRLSEFNPASGIDLPYSYAPGSHRLMSRGGDLREMDAAGNSTRIGSRRFDYGPNGRLVAVREVGSGGGLVSRDASGSVLAEYVHSGRGERVRKAVSGRDASLFVYGEGGELLGEYGESGQPLWEIIWLDGRPVGALHQRQLWAIETDHLSTPRALRDRRGTAHWRWDLLGNAFGAHAAETDPDGNGVGLDVPLRYPGQYFDAETVLHYNYFRDYEAVTGRYVQSDPIGLRGGISTFLYSGGNPMVSVDPYGLATWKGYMVGGGGAFYAGFSVIWFELEAPCQNGKKGTASVLYVGPVLGMYGRLGVSASSVSFEDHRVTPTPSQFSGGAGWVGAGFVRGVGLACGVFVLGMAEMKAGNAEAAGCGPELGVNVGFGVSGGSSTVWAAKVEDCDGSGCE